MLQVFLDANVYFAGCWSPTGASALVLQLAMRHHIQAVASRLVLREAERNLRTKGGRQALQTFHRFVRVGRPRIIRTPSESVLARYEDSIHPKDVPVLAAAVEASSDYLITLDRRHFLIPPVRLRAGHTRILTPGDFLKVFVRRA